MKDIITIKKLTNLAEADLLDLEFSQRYRWYSQGDYFHKCLEENLEGKRITLMMFYEDALAGCCHILYHSEYSYFRNDHIPEINDLNVFPEYRRKRIASRVFDE